MRSKIDALSRERESAEERIEELEGETRSLRDEVVALKGELAYAVKRIVESHGVGFAFPSTSLYVESLPFGSPEPFPAP